MFELQFSNCTTFVRADIVRLVRVGGHIMVSQTEISPKSAIQQFVRTNECVTPTGGILWNRKNQSMFSIEISAR